MKYAVLILLCALLMSSNTTKAQGGLLLSGGIKVVCNGIPYIVINDGKWKNTASTFTRASSTVKFTGTASANNSVIEGDSTAFYNLEIAKSQNNLKLLSNSISINNHLKCTSKNLDLNGKIVYLANTSIWGYIINESETARTYSAMPLSRVVKTQSIANPANYHLGNMGMRFTATGAFGNTTVDRRHKVQTLPFGDGIQKYWRVTTTNIPAAQNATLRFQYFDAELNGLNEATLTIWRSTNSGTTWTDMGVTTRSTASNYVEKTLLTDISGWWTLGASAPVIGPSDERSDVQNEPPPETTWHIFPNPASQWVTLEIPSREEKSLQVDWLSVDGKIALTSQYRVLAGQNTFSLDIGSLAPGTYFARIAAQAYPAIRVVKTTSIKN